MLRNPAYLAKTVSTLDTRFKGRYDVILGAGWMKEDWEGYDLMGDGSDGPPGWKRADLLIETMRILRGMSVNELWSYESRYWKLVNAHNYPLPVQQSLPIHVGASRLRVVRAAVKYGDGLNMLTVGGGLGSIRSAKELLIPALDKYGKSLEEFGFSGFDHTVWLYDTEEEYDKAVKVFAERRKRSVEQVKADMFMGTSEALVEKFRAAEDLGVDTMILFVRPTGDVGLAKENLARFRDEVVLGI